MLLFLYVLLILQCACFIWCLAITICISSWDLLPFHLLLFCIENQWHNKAYEVLVVMLHIAQVQLVVILIIIATNGQTCLHRAEGEWPMLPSTTDTTHISVTNAPDKPISIAQKKNQVVETIKVAKNQPKGIYEVAFTQLAAIFILDATRPEGKKWLEMLDESLKKKRPVDFCHLSCGMLQITCVEWHKS